MKNQNMSWYSKAIKPIIRYRKKNNYWIFYAILSEA